MGAIGTEELRLDGRLGEGDLRRFDEATGGGEDGAVRGNNMEDGLNGNLDRNGGCRTFRYILKFRSARFA